MVNINVSRDQARQILFAGYQNDERFFHLREYAKQFVPGVGPGDADVMFVGEAPGGREDTDGVPFVGPSGELLNGLLGSVGLRRSNVYITNIVKYRPPSNRTPTPQEVSDSMEYVQDEWLLVKPKMTVTLGKTSTMALLSSWSDWTQIFEDLPAMKELVGNPREDERGHWILPMWHPAYILRNRTLRESYIDSFANAYWQVFEEE